MKSTGVSAAVHSTVRVSPHTQPPVGTSAAVAAQAAWRGARRVPTSSLPHAATVSRPTHRKVFGFSIPRGCYAPRNLRVTQRAQRIFFLRENLLFYHTSNCLHKQRERSCAFFEAFLAQN